AAQQSIKQGAQAALGLIAQPEKIEQARPEIGAEAADRLAKLAPTFKSLAEQVPEIYRDLFSKASRMNLAGIGIKEEEAQWNRLFDGVAENWLKAMRADTSEAAITTV